MDTSSPGPSTGLVICFGTLCDVQAKVTRPPSDGCTAVSDIRRVSGNRASQFHLFEIVLEDKVYGIKIPETDVFIMIDLITAKKLDALQGQPGVYTKAVFGTDILNHLASKKGKQPFRVSVNVYGLESDASDVGTALTKARGFLQHPYHLEDGIEYLNPQFFQFEGDTGYMTHLVAMDESQIRAKALSDALENVLTSLDHSLGNPIITELDVIPDDLTTPLKDHQKSALSFISKCENSDYCNRVRTELLFHTRIPSPKVIPSMALGGILADVMGLGKTLTMITSICATKVAAINFQKTNTRGNIDDLTCPRTTATLVVVTSTQVMEVWRKEVSSHFKDGSLRTIMFHGDSRPTQQTALMDYDIVLTTYATLVADFKHRKVLHSLEWFRVILDEAHWIRNPSSKQFKAVNGLTTERRWCVSGTPIQNCLNDLVSLLRFLKFEPFCDMAVFQRYILEPLGDGSLTEPVNTLQQLLQCLCLRREGQYLNLPSATYSTVKLLLHPDEEKLYNDVFKSYRRELDDLVSGLAKAKKTRSTLRFSMMSALRRLCNHGTLLEPPRTLTELDVDTSCAYCSTADNDNMAKINEDSTCPECHRLLSASTPSSSKSVSQSPQPPGPIHTGLSMDAADTYTATLNRRPLQMHSGLSTKLQAVADNICRQSKSLVFSYWTTTLDLLEMLLGQRNIAMRRIDGRLGNEHRLRVLEEFKTNPDISVLLLTMQTGAVGLTLTIATHVHIIEPQWNPSVEEQAIARALRMGQTKTVTVFRYMMRNTVEERILALQKKKKALAKFTLGGNSGEGVSGSLEDLKFILELDVV
ncbi:uncharacterized protein FIESC28_07720 [Fusarium coffeatum]|uniref:Helicase ATP-binding domain-containing protein n=1 Tax=Fusarium coffeatum TaxID=231269 RepID=A0A366RBF5_9HYPO|nr:uncharacterized protein FIESC28_07720 [Fusarium coffeatum]RBR14484.1 hypothetical protein FIESC28_07720 [Fusarium coffeatum]